MYWLNQSTSRINSAGITYVTKFVRIGISFFIAIFIYLKLTSFPSRCFHNFIYTIKLTDFNDYYNTQHVWTSKALKLVHIVKHICTNEQLKFISIVTLVLGCLMILKIFLIVCYWALHHATAYCNKEFFQTADFYNFDL